MTKKGTLFGQQCCFVVRRNRVPFRSTMFLTLNRYNKLLKDTIRSHFQNKLHNNQGDLKKTWRTINELINKSKKENTVLEVRIDSVEITDPINISNAFNKHFVEMGDKLSNDIPQSIVTPESYLSDVQNSVNQLTCFREITEPEILGLLFRDWLPLKHPASMEFIKNFENRSSSNYSINCINF